MNIFKIVFTSKARRNLKGISDHYQRTASPRVANKVREGIIDSTEKLKTFPHRKPILSGTEDMNPPVRYTKKWSFKILFRIFSGKKQVQVLGIRHDKEPPEKTIKSVK